jgi:colanic acid biosynthesis glycosyl transferase WcaI
VKILIYATNFSPELTGIGKYTGEMANYLADLGHDIQVITAPPYYPEWKVYEEYSSFAYRTECFGKVQVWRCPLWVPQLPSGFKRIIHLLSFTLSSLPILLFQTMYWKPDALFLVEPTLLCAPSAWLVARLTGCKIWLHVQDFEVDAAFELGFFSLPWLKTLALKLERVLMRGFDKVSTISEQMLERLVKVKGVERSRCHLFPNWVDTKHIHPLNGPNIFRQAWQVDDHTCVILYSGNLGAKQGLELILDAAFLLKDQSQILFVICGSGASKEQLIDKASHLVNIKFLDLQPFDKLNQLLNAADIHLLPQTSQAADLVMPSKLQGMFASGRPVIATAHPNTQLADTVKDHGLVVTPGNAQHLAKAIQVLSSDPSLRDKLGKSARQYAEMHWDQVHILSTIEEEFLQFLSKTQTSPLDPVEKLAVRQKT